MQQGPVHRDQVGGGLVGRRKKRRSGVGLARVVRQHARSRIGRAVVVVLDLVRLADARQDDVVLEAREGLDHRPVLDRLPQVRVRGEAGDERDDEEDGRRQEHPLA